MSEKTRGSNGILPKIPHFKLPESSPDNIGPLLPVDVWRLFVFEMSDLAGLVGCGMSKICNVDLSDVTARSWLDGDMARENIVA